eukprot:SAG22_NODE_470_length_10142_cov_13.947227_6_plen_337_part_00
MGRLCKLAATVYSANKTQSASPQLYHDASCTCLVRNLNLHHGPRATNEPPNQTCQAAERAQPTGTDRIRSFPFADFGGEVERVLKMVDGVVLVVDATDGPNTQTTFVTEKALAHGLRPIVVLNKVDRPTRRVTEVENEVFDLLVGLDASDEQLDFRFIYSSAKMGWAVEELADEPSADGGGGGGDMHALLDMIVAEVPAPAAPAETGLAPADFSMAVSMTSYDSFVGRLCTGRVVSGSLSVGQQVQHIARAGGVAGSFKCSQIRAARGMGFAPVDAAGVGDIIQVAGSPTTSVGDTVGGTSVTEPLETPVIDPPTLSMTFGQNDSPLAGKEGTKLT